MNFLIKSNKTLLTYSLILLIIVPFIGINFFISFLGNILLLIFLIPLFLLLLAFIGFNSYKSSFIKCNNCGAISLGLSEKCINCGTHIEDMSKINLINKEPSEATIEVKAEEV